MTQEKTESKKPKNKTFVGLDVGTMNICMARNDNEQIKTTRNVFLELSKDDVSITELADISYIQSSEGNLFIIGEDAFRFANIFGQSVSRPMENGLISPKEISAIDVLTLIIKSLIGPIQNLDVYCSYSIPAESIDKTKSVTYHEKVFGRILSSLGINHAAVNEGMAIIFSECQNEKFSGVGISFGAGMVNTAISWRSVEVLKFSTARSGDWVDKSVAESLGIIPNRVTSIKERYLDLTTSFITEKNKKVRRVLEALEYYYNSLIEYSFKKLVKEFEDKVDIEVDESLPIIISGGTSLPKGFLSLFKEHLNKTELPFSVSEVRRASSPLTAVAKGLLVKTIADFQ